MGRFLGHRALLLLAALAVGCASAQSTTQRTQRSQHKPSDKVSPAARLVQQLAAVEDLGSPLNALDAASRRALDAQLTQLSAAERKQLQEDAALAGARPLLHLAGSGTLPVAYERLSFSSAAADELVALPAVSGDRELASLSQTINRVAELSARRVIRDNLAAHQGHGEWQIGHLLRVADALEMLKSWQLLQQVLQHLVHLAPEAPTRYRLALAKVRAADLVGAKVLLGSLTQSDEEIWRIRAKTALKALAVVERPQLESLDQRVTQAQAELHLNRVDQALVVLQPVQGQAPQHLGLAVTLIQAQLGNQLCPGIAPGLGNAALCAVAWRNANLPGSLERLLSEAWKSGQGRDPEAIEAALGLRYVVPLLFRASSADATQTSAALGGLVRSLAEVAQTPRLEALAQFARIVERAVTAGGKVSATERSAWQKEALAIYQKAPSESAAASTVLGLATWLAPSEDIRPLLDAVQPATVGDVALSGVWIKLNAASALLSADTARLERSKALLPGWLQSSEVPPQEHGALLLLLAQVEAALDPQNEKKWRTVLHLSGSDDTAAAALQAALASAVLSQRVTALQRLEQLSQRVEATLGNQDSLKTLVKVLTLALRGLESKVGADRAARAKEISALLPSFAGEPDAAGLQLWTQLWAKRMQLPDVQCSGLLCAAKLLANQRDLRQRHDPYLVRMVERGVLPLGHLGLSWSYSFERGLMPVIWAEPSWLLAP